jgi:putative colanic acid biosynthesis acetyltransferase WcaF
VQKLTTNLKKFDNSWYNPGSAPKRMLWLIYSALFFRHSLAIGSAHKRFILRAFGAKVGAHVVIKPSVNIKYPWKLSIGENTWVGENCWIDNLETVSIGANVCLSQGAMLLCGNHNFKKVSFDLMVSPITLEDGVWIGAQSTVCPGVTCHSHSVLSVGSVATKDLEPYFIYQGVPALKSKERSIDS